MPAQSKQVYSWSCTLQRLAIRLLRLLNIYVLFAVFPNPGGGSVKLVQVDKVKNKRILAEVTVHASIEEARTLLAFSLIPSDMLQGIQERPVGRAQYSRAP
jgi:hypothetical protein